MTATYWKKKIIKACMDVGTYQPAFDSIIDTLAQILQRRDEANAAFIKDGRKPIVTYINKAGAENLVKHPALMLWDELNKSALAYWRDLGLTPAGLKKLNTDVVQDNTAGSLEKLLSKL